MQCGELDIWLYRLQNDNHAVTESGLLINSDRFNNRNSEEVKEEITEFVGGKWVTKFKLRDWIFSRQRYWGEPIPVVHCEKCGIVPLPEKELPLLLPKIDNYKPSQTGESPLASIEKWVNTKCPKCIAEKNDIKYFIFDFDGVLGDTWNATVEARFAMDEDKSKNETISKLQEYFGKKPHHTRDSVQATEEIERDVRWSRSFGEQMIRHEINLFEDFINEVKKYKNIKCAVVSSGSGMYVKNTLKKSKIKFTHVLSFEDGKSKEDKIERVCKDWGVGVKQIHYFTDTKADVFELENLLDREKIIGCSWGFNGFDKLNEVLPERQILRSFDDIHRYFNFDCKAKRETDTMPNWAGSSWYYLRYADPGNKKMFASKENLEYWTPVDWYNGGMEHTTLHLLYSRFWHKFLYDLGLVPTKEPYKKRTSHGLILAEGGEKMSKSKGNVINPDSIVNTVGADTLRVHEMFMGPFDQAIAWDTNTIAGSRRFIERIWKLQEKVSIDAKVSEETQVMVHKTIKKVGEDIEEMRFNTAISSIMILLNQFEKESSITKSDYEVVISLVAPFAPHVTEELWAKLKNKGSVHASYWPKYDPGMLVSSTATISVQINGKTRGILKTVMDDSDENVKNIAMNMDEVKKWTEGKEIKKVIIIKNKIINIVV
jgi:leucyl-tRNA synthetase